METNVLDERVRFVKDVQSGLWTMTELCERYGISRPSGYKWLARFAEEGQDGLVDRSRAPHSSPHQIAADLEARLLAARREFGWGAKKLLRVLEKRHPDLAWPARSTINDLFARHGLLRKTRRRPHWTHPHAPAVQTKAPNQVWPADFKGQFKTRDGCYCYPLTVTDHFSRKLLVCRALIGPTTMAAKPVFRTVFRAIGLPDAIRTDNGAPFASTGLHGLSALSVWWMQLAIVHQRIRPASPQENGQHERMHRELKRETAQPPAASARAQQGRFDRFRARYNDDRPHEGLHDRTPSSVWQPSARPYPERIVPPEYPGHLEVRRVSSTGLFRWHRHYVFLSQTLVHQDIGLEEVGDGLWNIVFYRTLLGRLDERTMRVMSA